MGRGEISHAQARSRRLGGKVSGRVVRRVVRKLLKKPSTMFSMRVMLPSRGGAATRGRLRRGLCGKMWKLGSIRRYSVS